MAVNKVIYGTTVLVDLTEDTVTADTLMQGYTAHDKSGALITGTANTTEGSVYQDADGYLVLSDDGEGTVPSGSSLEYEAGEVTIPNQTTSNYRVSFSEVHEKPPSFYVISKADSSVYVNTHISVVFSLTEDYGTPSDENYNELYGTVASQYIGSSSWVSTAVIRLAYPSSNLDNSSSYYPRYWATESYITMPCSASRPIGGLYKWMAVWR